MKRLITLCVACFAMSAVFAEETLSVVGTEAASSENVSSESDNSAVDPQEVVRQEGKSA